MEWNDDGPRTLKAVVNLEGTLSVSPHSARQKANGYLGRYVAMSIQADEPILVWRKHPVWRMQFGLSLRGLGRVATLGTVEVDAQTREVIPLSVDEITHVQERANALALRLTPAAEAAV
ncbi:MAG: hypothetical protein HY328_15480 [Chloroflexi bacterium]|nr:hypothetical protein [Chloroflexota bacterium]